MKLKEVVICLLVGYLLGMLSPSYLLSRLKGFDIREAGSGNAGATNVYLTMGLHMGVVVVVFDIMKAVLAVRLTALMFPEYPLSYALTAMACVIGHVFPCYMGFRGGKGTACLAGIVISHSLRLFFLMLALAVLVALLTDYIGFAPVAAPVAFALLYGNQTRSLSAFLCLLILSGVMVYKHRENLIRIKNGTELHFSYLWKKQAGRDEELRRIRENGGEMSNMR